LVFQILQLSVFFTRLRITQRTAVYAAYGGNHSETLRSLNDDGTYQVLATFA
jgi:hypothetical protein